MTVFICSLNCCDKTADHKRFILTHSLKIKPIMVEKERGAKHQASTVGKQREMNIIAQLVVLFCFIRSPVFQVKEFCHPYI